MDDGSTKIITNTVLVEMVWKRQWATRAELPTAQRGISASIWITSLIPTLGAEPLLIFS